LFDKAFKYGSGVNFEVLLGQMRNHSVELCNFVECCILLNYLHNLLSVCMSVCPPLNRVVHIYFE
jgi:hypothetical protein